MIFKYGDCAIDLACGRTNEAHALRGHGAKVALKIVGLEEEENSPAGLVANASFLRATFGAGQEKPGSARARGAITTQRLVGEGGVSSISVKPSVWVYRRWPRQSRESPER